MKINFKLSMWKIVMSFVLLLCSSTIIQAQELVKGVVHSPEGDPLIGALIQVEQDASFQGTITDLKGEFQLTVSNLDVKLVSSYLGYLPKTTPLNGRSIVTIIMEEDTKELDEVIVVGYGVQKKHSVTGSIAQIDSEEILKSPIGNITASLAGKLPGLVATQKSGQPGSDGAGLKVRGISTLGNSAPIIIVDDVQRSFTNIDPNEIESISILKDATATAVYGMQAAAGVILVKTKRGKATKPTISYTGKVAYNQNTNYPKFLNGPDFITWYNKALEMDGEPAMFSDEIYDKVVNGDPDGKYANTNWFNKIMDSGAFSTHHNVNVNGGTKNVRYFVSLGYFNQDGIIKKVGFDRFNVRSNLDVNLKHGFKVLCIIDVNYYEKKIYL